MGCGGIECGGEADEAGTENGATGERETSTLKVSDHTLTVLSLPEREKGKGREGQHVSGEVV